MLTLITGLGLQEGMVVCFLKVRGVLHYARRVTIMPNHALKLTRI